jgi:PAS domain S-box-containing protein
VVTKLGGLQAMGGDVEGALGEVNVPCYVIDRSGVIRWLNPAARKVVGHAEGKYFLDIIAPADRRRAQEAFTRNVLGHPDPRDNKVEVVGPDGQRMHLEISSAPLRRGGHVIGMFGLAARMPGPATRMRHPHLTPRQNEVLHLLADGASTDEMAGELHISRETVRNHVRALFRALGVHSRVQAVATARADGLLGN